MSLIELPMEEQHRAIAIEQQGDMANFARGDLVNRWIERCRASGMDPDDVPTQYDVAYSYAHACNGSGETWRDCARVAFAVPPDMREEFGPLGFYAWRAIVPAGPSRIRDVARWAVEVYPLEHGGRPASPDAIKAYLSNETGIPMPEYRRLRQVQIHTERLIHDDRVRPEVALFYKRVQHIAQKRWGDCT